MWLLSSFAGMWHNSQALIALLWSSETPRSALEVSSQSCGVTKVWKWPQARGKLTWGKFCPPVWQRGLWEPTRCQITCQIPRCENWTLLGRFYNLVAKIKVNLHRQSQL
jgi:hypothetical protein